MFLTRQSYLITSRSVIRCQDLHLLDHRPEPASGDADVVLLPPALDPALRLRLPLPRHARLGASDRRVHSKHAFSPDRPWTDVKRRELRPDFRRTGGAGADAGD